MIPKSIPADHTVIKIKSRRIKGFRTQRLTFKLPEYIYENPITIAHKVPILPRAFDLESLEDSILMALIDMLHDYHLQKGLRISPFFPENERCSFQFYISPGCIRHTARPDAPSQTFILTLIAIILHQKNQPLTADVDMNAPSKENRKALRESLEIEADILKRIRRSIDIYQKRYKNK